LKDDHFGAANSPGEVSADEYLDMASFNEPNLVETTDEATLQPSMYLTAEEPEEDNILRTRTYDLSITYDKYYQTPRMWLFGYDENQQPLSPEEMFEDVMQDHIKQTVTMETHPLLDTIHASVHPCQHGPVMKRIVQNLCAGGRVPEVDQYLFIFLKFIQSVIPTVEYDYTMEVES